MTGLDKAREGVLRNSSSGMVTPDYFTHDEFDETIHHHNAEVEVDEGEVVLNVSFCILICKGQPDFLSLRRVPALNTKRKSSLWLTSSS